jgi:cation:H+ antiporter
MLLWIAVLIIGIILIAFSSDKAVKHSVYFASASGIRPLMIGFFIVSLGTDFPEIINSLISCSIGHGDIAAGDAIGSVLTQITLVLGILAFASRGFKIKRREILSIGACELLALILVYLVVEKGFLTRIDALFLVFSFPVYLLITHYILRGRPKPVVLSHPGKSRIHYGSVAVFGFIGVAIGAYFIIQSIINLSIAFNLPEFLLSFVLMSIGTSLPELAVDLTAIRRKQYEVAIGDIVGSCVVDASFSIGIGQLFFPQEVSASLAQTGVLYTLIASLIVISILALRKKLDKIGGILFIAVYGVIIFLTLI